MAHIGGNITATIQTCKTEKDVFGEAGKAWEDRFNHVGWLDMQAGDSKYTNFNAKLEESTHVFLCDYHEGIFALTIPDEKTKTVPDCRMIIKGMVYDVLLIDNPMEMNEHLEIHLRKVGAWHG